MAGSPFERAGASIPVTIVTQGPLPERDGDTAVLRLDPALHDHGSGNECVACAAAGDVRAMLFDLLTQARQEQRVLQGVVIDAVGIANGRTIADRLDPKTPAHGLRDHTVLRSFHLSQVI